MHVWIVYRKRREEDVPGPVTDVLIDSVWSNETRAKERARAISTGWVVPELVRED
jgi:hypothetical protein